MNKEDIVRAYAKESVGCPYIYGATGQSCTPAYREARMRQYPVYALTIRANCPRLCSSKDTCTGCKWARDGVGRPAYDCAQLTRFALAAAGVTLPSGANSQYNADIWRQKGEIARMPAGRVCLVFRRENDKMVHVGLALGDGTVIHASGHGLGVVSARLGAGSWTHYALPEGLDEQPSESAVYTVTGKQLALRAAPSVSGTLLTRLPTGTVVTAAPSQEPGWLSVSAGGKNGYCMEQYLQKRGQDEEDAEPEAEAPYLAHLYAAYDQLRAAIERAGGSV